MAFRLRLLDGAGRNAGSAPNAVGGARRQAAVLARVAQKAGWGSRRRKMLGSASPRRFGQERDMPTWVACVARVRVDRASGHVTVEKLTVVIDAGTISIRTAPRPRLKARALWGLSMALHEGSEFVKASRRIPTSTPIPRCAWAMYLKSRSSFSLARRRRLASANRQRPRWRPRSGTRSLPPGARAFVICRSGRTPCDRHSTGTPDVAQLFEWRISPARDGTAI